MMTSLRVLVMVLPALLVAGRSPPPPTRTLYVEQPVDHFRFGLKPPTFTQKLLVFDGYWRPNGPVLVYFGNEGAIEDFYENSGLLFDMAPELNASIAFLEHRYYGVSLPYGNASYESDRLAELTVEQALADMASFLSTRERYLGEAVGEAVLFGGSYGGMLAAWFMLKYPHLAAGALAASAPVNLYPGEHKAAAFREASLGVFGQYGSPACERDVRAARADAAKKAADADGRAALAAAMRTCGPLPDPIDGDRILSYVDGALATMAMLDYPFPTTFVTPMPARPVAVACARIADIDDPLLQLKAAVDVFLNSSGQTPCHNTSRELRAAPRFPGSVDAAGPSSLGSIDRPWNYQACTELILEPLTSNGDGFYVPQTEKAVEEVEAACAEQFGVAPRPLWLERAYGTGAQLVRSIRNTVFTDGDKDPWKVFSMPRTTEIEPCQTQSAL